MTPLFILRSLNTQMFHQWNNSLWWFSLIIIKQSCFKEDCNWPHLLLSFHCEIMIIETTCNNKNQTVQRLNSLILYTYIQTTVGNNQHRQKQKKTWKRPSHNSQKDIKTSTLSQTQDQSSSHCHTQLWGLIAPNTQTHIQGHSGKHSNGILNNCVNITVTSTRRSLAWISTLRVSFCVEFACFPHLGTEFSPCPNICMLRFTEDFSHLTAVI